MMNTILLRTIDDLGFPRPANRHPVLLSSIDTPRAVVLALALCRRLYYLSLMSWGASFTVRP
jgi:hypothetical protein